ncbi:family 43 glycosylhydrolase [Pedobacter sp. SYSU D00535]|uniref:family 43 glycosylhydrolase n=1 Tax=Pedobacter sp. SYSU D00535 TaxID=2810308 RepID=UPI001A963BD1|nr:family 43 glycosylhydrolase [Pedobacter sp. SYSU D00535]
MRKATLCCFLLAMYAGKLFAQNPFITDQFTADPSARVFGDRVYVYPSHDIPPAPGKGRANWFVMEDYRVFSSTNLTDWTDHGVIITQNKVPWVKPDSYSMWAPDCVYRNGKYYFYFPSTSKDTTKVKGFTIGVAVADKPTGPFVPQSEPIANVKGIDPNVFIDKDGQAYLYWSQEHIYGARLKENMLELASEPFILGELPTKGLKEGPYVFERKGIYYMTYPHVENKIERLEYAIGDNPLGPFKYAGVIMDESPTGCWTNHHSVINFKNQWYLFYHHNDLSPDFDKNRSIRADSLSFNEDGTIRKVIPTLRGVGLTSAFGKIQIDRYSGISNEGVSLSFVDTADRFQGWKAKFSSPDAWLQYNNVDFGKIKAKSVALMVTSDEGGTLQIRSNSPAGPVLAELTVPASRTWTPITAKLSGAPTGIQHLYITQKGAGVAEVDWIAFK